MSGIHMAMMAAGGKFVEINNFTDTAFDSSLSPDTAIAELQYSLRSNGRATAYFSPGSPVDLPGQWLLAGAAADYEVRFTLLSGAFQSGNLGNWLSLSVDRSIAVSVTRTAVGEETVTGTALVEIRRVGAVQVLDSAQIELTAIANVDI